MTALEVNGIQISGEAIRAESARLRQQARQDGHELSLDEANALLVEAERLLVEPVLLDQEALRLGIDVLLAETSTDKGAVLAGRERQLRIDTLLEFWTHGVRPPGQKVIRQIYLQERERFRVPESLLVSQIVKNVWHADEREKARDAIASAARELAAGRDFASVAADHSDCPGQGGALGYLTRGDMVPEFDEVVFALPVGNPSPVFETRFGFHIARVGDRRPAGIRPLSEAAPLIAKALWDQQKEKEVTARLEELHARASIRRIRVSSEVS